MDAAATGIMKIKIVEARLTRDTEFIGKMDPFVVLNYREQQYKTKALQGAGKTPAWKDEEWTVEVKYIGDDVKFTVFDEDVTTNDTVGSGTVKMSAFAINGGIDEWYDIQYKGKAAGKVHMVSKWHP